MRKQQDVDWHLDLKPVRRPVKTPSAASRQAAPAASAEPAHVRPHEPSPEFLQLLNTLNDKIDTLTARLARVERALAEQSRRAAEVPDPTPGARRDRPQRLRSAPAPIERPGAETAAS